MAKQDGICGCGGSGKCDGNGGCSGDELCVCEQIEAEGGAGPCQARVSERMGGNNRDHKRGYPGIGGPIFPPNKQKSSSRDEGQRLAQFG